MQREPTARAALDVLAASVLWGGMYVVSAATFARIPPVTLGLLRLLVGAAVPLDSATEEGAMAEGAMAATDQRERWALILGASSGFGEATALALAAAGYRIVGVHLDFRSALTRVNEIRQRIAAAGSEALFLNMNAADDEKRASAIEQIRARFAERREEGADPYLRVVVHSLAFGTLLPFVADDPKEAVNRKQMEMTLDVMANSLVYWVQDLLRAGLLGRGTHVYAMTSEGSSRVIPTYGAVSAAKAAIESHCRQLAAELARKGTGITVNAIRAGVTLTPALMKIPEHQLIIEAGERRNPSGRLTTPRDVGSAIVKLSEDGLDWVTGNVIGVDGGEFIAG